MVAALSTHTNAQMALPSSQKRFQSAISQAYWYLEPGYFFGVSDGVRAQFAAEFDALRATKQFVGRQWLHASYRSFDIQAEDLVVVTVRETWEDALYNFQEMPGDEWPPTDPIARRGPYALDVTYTLARQEDQWQIANVVFNNKPPAWTE